MENIKFSVTKYGKPLSAELYTWDEKNRYFCSSEDGLVLDFTSMDRCTFKTGNSCDFKTGDSCTFNTGNSCTFKTGSDCTFKTHSYCYFRTGDDCTFKTHYDCTFKTGDSCTFKTRSDCTFSTGDDCKYEINGKSLRVPPLRFNGSKYFLEYYKPGMIKSGCIIKPLGWWRENIKRCAEENGYTPDQINEYEIYIELLSLWMERFGVEEQTVKEVEI